MLCSRRIACDDAWIHVWCVCVRACVFVFQCVCVSLSPGLCVRSAGDIVVVAVGREEAGRRRRRRVLLTAYDK